LKQRSSPLSWITVDDAELSVDEFPDGSFRFTVDYQGTDLEFVVRLKSTLPEAIVATYQVCFALLEAYLDNTITVIVQTMPDQRADRAEAFGMTNAAHVSAHLLANLPCDQLVVFDLHSNVSRSVLTSECNYDSKQLEINEPLDCFLETLEDCDMDPDMRIDHVVAVDKGAEARAESIAAHFGASVIYADKKRVGGKVIGHELVGTLERPIKPTDTIWIVDDLCDGGATFISIAQLLRRNMKFGELNLYVTHGLFSKGKEELFKYYTTILALFDYGA
jgi:ribose-phosphate pyrophosphokinase